MNEDLNLSNYILDFNFPIPKDLRNNFQGIFSYIKKKFQIKYSRKSHIDSLLKKCKGKFFKTIHEIMNTSLSITVKRLPQKFITNITIEYNQNYLKKNNKKQPFEQFCTYNLMNLYNIYLESQRYFNEINEVKKHDGRRIGLLYQFVSKNFCNYFENNKPHMVKTKEEFKENNNINHNINKNNEFNKKNNDENNELYYKYVIHNDKSGQ